MKIVTPAEMARLERGTTAFGLSTDDLMEQAGLAIAQEIRRALGGTGVAGKRVLMLVGPGNNGGDGLVAARHLARWGASVILFLATIRPDDDPNLRLALSEGAQAVSANSNDSLSALERALRSSHVVVDAVLGTGRSRPLSGALANVMARVSKNADLPRNRRPLYVAVDVPTGIDAATGRADPLTPRTDLTLALGFPKVGHFIFPAPEYMGVLNTLDIGIPPELSKDISLELITPSWVRQQLPQRGLNGHKGTYGHALIVGGSVNYPGAACLAAGAALRSGPGLVTLAVPQGIYGIAASKLTEAIHLPLPDNGSGCLDPQALPAIRQASSRYSSMAVGCGMGRSESAKQFLRGLLLSEHAPPQPLVIDADALNILAESCPDWWQRIPATAVLTPHPGEMARLTGLLTTQIQARRVETAREYAHKWGHVVVLKGAFTVVAQPEGPCRIAPFANPLLSVGGTGDVLSGIIGGLLAQGMKPADAAACGVYLHGAAADSLRATHGDRGATAGDIINALPGTTRAILQDRRGLAPQPSSARYASSSRSTTWHTLTSAPA